MVASNGIEPKADPKVLLEQLRLLNTDPEAFRTDGSQIQEIKHLARFGSIALEEPFETMQRTVYSPLLLVGTRIGQSANIFSTLVAAQEPSSFSALADASRLEPGILEALLDYLCAQSLIKETEPGQYIATKLTHLFTIPLFQDATTHFHDNCAPGFNALHAALSQPEKKLSSFKLGQHTDDDFYLWLESHPIQAGAFHRFMEAQFASLPTWLDAVDYASQAGQGLTPDDVALVDVGGGIGQQCSDFRKKFPDLPGRIILQDREAVLSKAVAVDGMEKMPYDYLTEQPIKNARVYYFRQIMHNNDDETCIKILEAHLPAMGPESLIIIDDKTLPDEKPPSGAPGIEYTAGLSIAMKVMFNAQERREAHWKRLIEDAGLVVKDIRKFTKFDDSVIIATKP